MGKLNLSKKETKFIHITIFIAFILQFFIPNAMNIYLCLLFIYANHKFLFTTENIKEYENYIFKDKARFDSRKKSFGILIDIYAIVRTLTLFLTNSSDSLLIEFILVVILFGLYEEHLTRKYVESTGSEIDNIKTVFIRNKLITSILLIGFTIFSVFTFITLNNLPTSNHIKYGGYLYNLETTNNTRKIEMNTGSRYMMFEENEKNSGNFDSFLSLGKDTIEKKIFHSYTFISVLIFLALMLSQVYPRNKKISSTCATIFLILFAATSWFTFSYQSYPYESNLADYFHTYIVN